MLEELLIYFLIAVGGAFGLILISKFVMNAFMRKSNGYYTAAESKQEQLMLKSMHEAETQIEKSGESGAPHRHE